MGCAREGRSAGCSPRSLARSFCVACCRPVACHAVPLSHAVRAMLLQLCRNYLVLSRGHAVSAVSHTDTRLVEARRFPCQRRQTLGAAAALPPLLSHLQQLPFYCSGYRDIALLILLTWSVCSGVCPPYRGVRGCAMALRHSPCRWRRGGPVAFLSVFVDCRAMFGWMAMMQWW